MLPDERGFAVNVRTGEYHKKYAVHARGLRRTTPQGLVALLLDGTDPVACRECFPEPVEAPKRKSRAKAPVTATLAAADDDDDKVDDLFEDEDQDGDTDDKG